MNDIPQGSSVVLNCGIDPNMTKDEFFRLVNENYCCVSESCVTKADDTKGDLSNLPNGGFQQRYSYACDMDQFTQTGGKIENPGGGKCQVGYCWGSCKVEKVTSVTRGKMRGRG